MKKITIAAALLAAAALATPALAHPGLPGHAHGFLNGLLHPVGGLDHLLAMIGVGFWSALLVGGAQVFLAPAGFVLAMLAGAALGVNSLYAVETGIALSVVALGLLILGRIKLPLVVSVILIGCFGALHGYAHGSEASGNIAAYMAGFALTTATLHVLGIGLGRTLAGLPFATVAAGALMTAAGASLLIS